MLLLDALMEWGCKPGALTEGCDYNLFASAYRPHLLLRRNRTSVRFQSYRIESPAEYGRQRLFRRKLSGA